MTFLLHHSCTDAVQGFLTILEIMHLSEFVVSNSQLVPRPKSDLFPVSRKDRNINE